ncbi:UNVERIFIED_CONTAM: hypothetical protein HDU68_008624 [Siphonaria sp. JEL0065]|nr:hypothetical protein HDU68_008624 [Siphonaria sp. JEL0065]
MAFILGLALWVQEPLTKAELEQVWSRSPFAKEKKAKFNRYFGYLMLVLAGHKSLRDAVTSKELVQYADSPQAHYILANSSLDFLLTLTKARIKDVSIVRSTSLDRKDLNQDGYFLQYAAMHWFIHVKETFLNQKGQKGLGVKPSDRFQQIILSENEGGKIIGYTHDDKLEYCLAEGKVVVASKPVPFNWHTNEESKYFGRLQLRTGDFIISDIVNNVGLDWWPQMDTAELEEFCVQIRAKPFFSNLKKAICSFNLGVLLVCSHQGELARISKFSMELVPEFRLPKALATKAIRISLCRKILVFSISVQ